VVKFSDSDEAARQRIAAETHQEFGRFVEPTVRRILGKAPSREFSEQAWKLLEATKPLLNNGKNLAANKLASN